VDAFDRLVELLEECSRRSSDCKGCPLFDECRDFWVTSVVNHVRGSPPLEPAGIEGDRTAVYNGSEE